MEAVWQHYMLCKTGSHLVAMLVGRQKSFVTIDTQEVWLVNTETFGFQTPKALDK